MRSTATGVAVALTFLWLGLVLGISFIEAPLKFRAPDVTLRIGLGIGRLVFRALNAVELVVAVALTVTLALGRAESRAAEVALVLAGVALLVQLVLVRPRLARRTDAVLAGDDAARSHAHVAYVALEGAKVVALVVGGALLIAG